MSYILSDIILCLNNNNDDDLDITKSKILISHP